MREKKEKNEIQQREGEREKENANKVNLAEDEKYSGESASEVKGVNQKKVGRREKIEEKARRVS